MQLALFRQTTIICICTTWILLQTACKPIEEAAEKPVIIPIPAKVVEKKGQFLVRGAIKWEWDKALLPAVNFLKEYLSDTFPEHTVSEAAASHRVISFSTDTTMVNTEGYRLNISRDSIEISSKTVQGALYAVQTIRQLLPPCMEDGSCNSKAIAIPALFIEDAPKYQYRGMHLDVGRHFYSVRFIKKYIDMLSLLKMNFFHWHLTEDQGWRIEIKKYPRLTEHAAYRKETLIGHYNDQPHGFDGKPYGGFYTQEEIKEIVNYATLRGVTVIPEIEMPGHSQAAISAYPELGCTGDSVAVATKWGVFEEVYCPKETTFSFLEDIIDEVVSLFPGKYIHIGGDEAPKTRWKKCAHCKKLIETENLKDEHGLQSYFISRMEKYINSKGKQIIGWDEILEGGLAPNATVMSWRGTKGAVEAAKQQHHVIMTPTSHCYFDYYQSEDESEPLAIGGYLPLEKVYSFNPVPEELNSDESKYVLGAQGNVWTEYMPTEAQVEYMAFPRMMALSEVVWSPESRRNYSDFLTRLEWFYKRLDRIGINYANHLFNIKGTLHTQGGLGYELETPSGNKEIRYTLDGSNPGEESEVYKEIIPIDSSVTLKAMTFAKGEALGPLFEQRFVKHKAVGQKISLSPSPDKAYGIGGKEALINSISGSNTRYGDSEWLGFWGKDLEIKIDFNKPTRVTSLNTRFFNEKGSWIYAPRKILVFCNNDSIPKEYEIKTPTDRVVAIRIDLGEVPVKHLKLIVKQYGIIPDGKQGAGNPAWTFIDEIQLW